MGWLRTLGVFWRAYFDAERLLARLPLLILVPTFGAFLGTVWALSHPTEVLRQGVLVPIPQSFWDVLLTALAWGAISVVAVGGIVFSGAWMRYRVSGQSDGRWEAASEQGPESQIAAFELRAKVPIQLSDYIYNECHLRTPSGELVVIPDDQIRSLGFGNRTRLVAMYVAKESGRYEVRWFDSNDYGRRLREITRTTCELSDNRGVRPTKRRAAR